MKTRQAPPPTLRVVETRTVRVADEDDDRRNERDGYANPMFVRAGAEGIGRGWNPAITRRLRDGVALYEHAADFPGYAGTAGYFDARLTERGDVWRVSCAGAGNTLVARDGLAEAKARRLWAQLRDHVTRRTLKRLGFRAE